VFLVAFLVKVNIAVPHRCQLAMMAVQGGPAQAAQNRAGERAGP
jgi:hypothetical protein